MCVECGSTALALLRVGVTRAREELEALALEPVAMTTASSTERPFADARIVIGTSAALHRCDSADVVAFLDLDQELLAPRYRAAEEALGLLGAREPCARWQGPRGSLDPADQEPRNTRSCRRRSGPTLGSSRSSRQAGVDC
ncbi:MAG: hypothetical protein V9E94_06330 [Microthrixaceae bacterium]